MHIIDILGASAWFLKSEVSADVAAPPRGIRCLVSVSGLEKREREREREKWRPPWRVLT